ncbi:DoxX family protein [Novosphingobium pentaromativorans]|uniref:DoxX family protein n=1 Tax=Novosphingobium pentaromativorans US6-1 TaxID=1088721 RepID=G6EE17_9SPHN|nr:DoxX family protein [Novosphingobium pentaromativorans]AIT79573.1 LysR family transcriptional regulator [Novosphingobium pentaromativorans US6-1]EHJ60458.1 DoxX family protein [Novosphingobium pentaromativorans US6-1]
MAASSIDTASRSTSSTHDVLALVGRIAIAGIFVLAGLSKITDPAGTMGYIASVGLPFPALGLIGAILIEVVGSLALIVGYRTRTVAILLAAFSVVTALIFHNQLGDQMQFLNFFKNIAIAGGLLNVAALGGGRLSLDARR